MDYYFFLKDTFDGSDPSDISKIDPFYCAGERLEKTYYELVFKSMQNELLEILVTALAQIDTDSALLNILKDNETPGALIEALTKVYGKIDTTSVSQHMEALTMAAPPSNYQNVIALCDIINEVKLRLTAAQAKFPDAYYIIKCLDKLKQPTLYGVEFQIQLQMHELQMGKSWPEIRTNLMAWARTMISAQTGFQGVGTTGGTISYIATAPPPPQYYNRGRGQGKGRGRGRGRGRRSRGKSSYSSQQPHRPGHYTPTANDTRLCLQ